VLLGEEEPTAGEVIRADTLRVAHFEQNRASLDPDRTLAETVCPDGDFVYVRGAPVHRNGYLERFLFRADQMNQPVRSLSGGEQSRLLIARLMLEPVNVLVLDEPTNDLDFQTLDVLEDALSNFDGAVLLVTHDRYFLDQVTTELLAFHTRPGEEGRVTKLVGLEQWELFHVEQSAAAPRADAGAARGGGATSGGSATSGEGATKVLDGAAAGRKKKKLSYGDQRDFDTIEGRILEAEGKLAALTEESVKPDVVSDHARLVVLGAEMTAARAEVDRLYARWAELEAMVGG
jgi:ATP-binding cassette subfamily F protein uup